MNDPFLDADDLGETPQDYDLLTSADEDVVLRHTAYLRQSGTYGTTTPPSIMTSESRINEVETDEEPPASFRAAPMANLRVLLRGVMSAKNFKITLILCVLAFAIGCLMSQAEVEEEKHLIGLSAAVPIISFPPFTLRPSLHLHYYVTLCALHDSNSSLTLLSATC